MKCWVVGFNHKTTPFQVRESLARAEPALRVWLQEHKQQQVIAEYVLVFTCNRAEVYVVGRQLTPFLEACQKLWAPEVWNYAYTLEGLSAIGHLMRVASGLDSLIMGEPQILGQIKAAYQDAHKHQSIGKWSAKIFERTFSVAKKIRTHTDIGTRPVSVAYTAVWLAKKLFDQWQTKRVGVVGAGVTAKLLADHLYKLGVREFIFFNRSQVAAEKLAAAYQGQTLPLSSLGESIASLDVLASATGSLEPLITTDMLQQALSERQRATPLLLLDLAMPRDISPEAAELEGVYLYNLEALQNLVSLHQQLREGAQAAAEVIIQSELVQLGEWLTLQARHPTIRHYRISMEEHKQQILSQAKRALAAGQDPESVLEWLAYRLAQKTMHVPTQWLREPACFPSFEKEK